MGSLSIRKLIIQKEAGTLSDDILNSYCMIVKKFHQYAEGVTGSNHTCTVYIKTKDIGYSYAAEGYKALKDAGIKKINIKGHQTPYGNIGQIYQDREAMKIGDFLDTQIKHASNPYYVYQLTPLVN